MSVARAIGLTAAFRASPGGPLSVSVFFRLLCYVATEQVGVVPQTWRVTSCQAHDTAPPSLASGGYAARCTGGDIRPVTVNLQGTQRSGAGFEPSHRHGRRAAHPGIPYRVSGPPSRPVTCSLPESAPRVKGRASRERLIQGCTEVYIECPVRKRRVGRRVLTGYNPWIAR